MGAWPCTWSTPTTSSAPACAPRTGCPPSPPRRARAPCSVSPPARGSGPWCWPTPATTRCAPTIEVVTPTAVFAPAGVEPVRVAPGSTESVSLDDVLADATAQGATGLRVTASAPVTAGLRQVVGDDLSLLAPAPAVSTTTAAVVPAGTSRLLLGDPAAAGTATVTSYDARGRSLGEQPVELTPDAGADVALPEGTALVTLTPQGTSVRAALITTGTGVSVVALRELVTTGRVPDVRPGVP